MYLFWLQWVFFAARRLSLAAEWRLLSGCTVQAPHCGDVSCRRAQTPGARASVVEGCRLSSCGLWALEHVGFSSCGVWAHYQALEHGLSGFPACGIFLNRGWNSCPLHRQVDSYLLCHQGTPVSLFFVSVSVSIL